MKNRALIAFLFILATASTSAFGASFDCQKPASHAEKSICSDEELFSLDDDLAKAYVAALREHPNLRESQRRWLRQRNACQIRECLVAAYRTRIAELSKMISKVEKSFPFDGVWEIVWSCAGSSGLYAERCADGVRDSFTLAFQTKGEVICGYHSATAQLGNRIDSSFDGEDPSIIGAIVGNSATVQFTSAWGAKGTALLLANGDELRWNILQQSEGERESSWLPAKATLTRTRKSTDHRGRNCLAALPAGREK